MNEKKAPSARSRFNFFLFFLFYVTVVSIYRQEGNPFEPMFCVFLSDTRRRGKKNWFLTARRKQSVGGETTFTIARRCYCHFHCKSFIFQLKNCLGTRDTL